MSLRQFHVAVIATWFGLVASTLGMSTWLGVPWSLAQGSVGLGLACLPPLVFLLIFRGAPPQTIGQVLHTEEQRASDVAARLERIARGQ